MNRSIIPRGFWPGICVNSLLTSKSENSTSAGFHSAPGPWSKALANPKAARRWAVQDGCGAAPTVNRTSPGVTLTTYHGCRGAGAVLLYTLTGRGHVWPSARSGFDCDETVWRFFAEHSRQVADRIPTAD